MRIFVSFIITESFRKWIAHNFKLCDPLVLIGRDRGKRCLRKYERPVCQHVLLGFDWAPVVVVIDGTASREVADMKARLIPMHGVEDDVSVIV